jgi:uncharacterized membrane protein
MRGARSRNLATQLLGPFFIVAGALHFVRPRPYQAIVPPYVPRPREVVAVSGAAEIVGGVSSLSGRTPKFTRWWLTALLVAVFPANLHMALNPDQVRGLSVPRWLLWARLPLQPVLVAWVWRATR